MLWFLKLYHWTKALIKCLFYWLSTQNFFNVADNNKQLTLLWFLIGLLHKVKVKIRTKSAVCCCLQYWASFELIINKISFITKKHFVKVFDHRISKIITKSAVCCCLQYCYEISVLLIIIHSHYQLTAEFWIYIVLSVFERIVTISWPLLWISCVVDYHPCSLSTNSRILNFYCTISI